MAASDDGDAHGQSGGNSTATSTNRRITNGDQVIVARDYDGIAAVIAVEPDRNAPIDDVMTDLRSDAERIVDDDLAVVDVSGGDSE